MAYKLFPLIFPSYCSYILNIDPLQKYGNKNLPWESFSKATELGVT